MYKKFSVLTKNKIKKFSKIIAVDPDKSISHRCYIIASQCIGVSKIKGLNSEDVQSTKNGLRHLGIKIVKKNDVDLVYGMGISGFKKFKGILNFSNSGTSARGFLGILTCFPYPVTVTGDSSLKLRPFKRLTDYLEKIGATITHPKNKKNSLPIKICGTKDWALAQKHYVKVKSAQIASALIYAAIGTTGITEIIESAETRDHTQRLLKILLKKNISVKEKKGERSTKIRGQVEMNSFSIKVASDPSSACYFCVQTLLAKKSSLLIKNVYINKTRIGWIQILKRMGGKIKIFNKKEYFGEPVGDLFVQSSNLRGIKVPARWITSSIDDLVACSLAFGLAKGQSEFSAPEMILKESNRIKAISELLNKLGIRAKIIKKSSLKIWGNPNIKSETKKIIKISSNLDHRVAMTCFIASTIVPGATILIKDFETIKSSFPNFLKLQKKIGVKYEIKKN
ncbi:3-phosphoshikimate 1-carboxyvinyltransferase [Pelagibacteraceae bacterium]|nr:3-phosphoshikimate 1-carboxyvinyltransferase [Pelagibacteraceae bacterium]